MDNPTSSIVFVDFKLLMYKFKLFSPGGVFQESNRIEDFVMATRSPQNFIIYDMGGTPDTVPPDDQNIKAQAIVLSSANASHFALFSRERSSIKLVMKTWSREEIDDARNHIYPGSQLDDYLLRYRDLGGVPRYVLKGSDSHAKVVKDFQDDLPPPEDIMKVLRTKDLTMINVDKGGRLITYETNDDMEMTGVRWVSDPIGQWAMKSVAQADEQRTMELLWALSENPTTGGSFGLAFEPYAHLKLAEGGLFDCRKMNDPVTEKQYIKPSETTYFDQFNQVANEVVLTCIQHMLAFKLICSNAVFSRSLFMSQTYGRPSIKTLKSVDAIYQPDKIFQMTVSTDKDVYLSGLSTCIAGMSSSPQDFYVVVPQMRYRTFTHVTLLPAGTAAWPGTIRHQYVLSIPMRRKRQREELVGEAKSMLVNKQKLDVPAVEALLEEIKDDDDVATLAIHGITMMQRRHATWMEVGKYPATNPALHVFKQPTGSFVALPKS